ncbi:MAG: plasma membrane fusion protein prm1 [Alectoria sarmentosa]|nr:MAG: plasma membrane fusion protein prm1 [Alectoria sarmentosa]
MSFSGNQHRPNFPAVPPSLSAGDHGTQDHYAAQDIQRPTPHTVSNITPYLGLRARLSQVWINRWTILLLLVLVRLLIAIAGLHNDLGSAKSEAMSACTGVESIGSAMASMPHYLAAGVNDLAGTGIEKAVDGLMSMLLLTVTGIEDIVVFVINMMTSTYMCLITLVVAGSLHVALQVAEDVSNFLNSTLKDIGNEISSGVTGFESDLNKFTKDVMSSIPQALGLKGESAPTLNITGSLDKLNNLQLPATLDEGLTKLNNSIPNFQDVQNFTDNLIRLPFEDLKTVLNGSLHFNFNRSLLPVPQKEQLTFCSGNNGISDFFDDLVDIADLVRRIFIAVLIILAILVCIPMAYQEIRRWRTMKKRSELVADKSFDPLDVMYIASRPYTATAGIKAAAPFGSTKRQILTRWVIAYATSPPALLVLSLGITGLLSCLCQYILLKAVVREVPALANEVGQFAGLVVDKLENASEAWANGTNNAIMGINNDINHKVFGWVNVTTGAINDTLNMFVSDTIGVLNDTFGGTVLYGPVTGIFECLVGLKVAGIQKGLDWVSDNANVNFPTIPNDTFSLGAAASIGDPSSSNASESFLASPGSETTNDIEGAVLKVTSHLANGIRTEALISTSLLLIWFIILLLGIMRALYLGFRHEKGRAVGGPSYAGDIPMEEQPTGRDYSTAGPSGPAPAYEPPISNTAGTTRPFPSFGVPMGQSTPMSHRQDYTNEEQWQDEKLGFAGLREPARASLSPGHLSQYGRVEKS